MTSAWWAEQCSLCLAALLLAWRARTRPPLRPFAAALCLVAVLDLAMLAPLPRWAYVGAFAGWYCAQALAVACGLLAHWRPLAAAAAVGWWAVEVWRVLGPPGLVGAPLKAEWWALWAVATAGQLAAVACWLPGAVRRGGWPGEGEVAALLVTAGAVADAVGPWLWGPTWASERWEVGRWQSVGTWACVVGASAWRWGREHRPAR